MRNRLTRSTERTDTKRTNSLWTAAGLQPIPETLPVALLAHGVRRRAEISKMAVPLGSLTRKLTKLPCK
jgi:hypothetical protein